jgi:hypothetical protein
MTDKKAFCLDEPCHSGESFTGRISLGPHLIILAASETCTLPGSSENRSVPIGPATFTDITVLLTAFSANITTTTGWLLLNT